MLKAFLPQVTRTFSEIIPDVSGLLEKQYRHQVEQNHIRYDEAQLGAIKHLQALLENLLSEIEYRQKSVVQKLVSAAPERCRSLYIFGDVGRGKSMLMALFYDACPFKQKRRVHFNSFMLEVHAFIHHFGQKNNTDAITALAQKISNSVFLLCFDEFHVTDIADAMILGRLFSKLFDSGTIVVITSNRHPNDLYQGGLQREQFLFFIKVLRQSSHIIELVAKEDYRLSHLPTLQTTYYFPLDDYADDFIRQTYQQLSHSAAMQPAVLQVFGRKVYLAAIHQDIIISSFDELCAQPLGSADYLEIANRFSTLILSCIPKLTAEKRNEAKRFVTLIDALYEHKVKLICSAEVPAQELYVEGDGAFEFRRTVSRLIEMQSAGYLHSAPVRS